MLKEILSSANMLQAYDRVVSNKGAAGIDGLGGERLHGHIKEHWASIRAGIEASTYIPQAVAQVLSNHYD